MPLITTLNDALQAQDRSSLYTQLSLDKCITTALLTAVIKETCEFGHCCIPRYLGFYIMPQKRIAIIGAQFKWR